MRAQNHREQRFNNELKNIPIYFDNYLRIMNSEENNQDPNERMKSKAHQEYQNTINSPSVQCMDSSFLLSTLLNKHNEMPKKVLDEIPESQLNCDTDNTVTTNVSVQVQRNYFALPSHANKPYQIWSPFANYNELINQKVILKFSPWIPMYLQLEHEIAEANKILRRSSSMYFDNSSRKRKSEFDNSQHFKMF